MNHFRRPITENIEIQRILDSIKVPAEGLQIVPCDLDTDTHILFDNSYSQMLRSNPHEFTF